MENSSIADAQYGKPTSSHLRSSIGLLLVLISIIPLLWPSLPPLVDLPGHMARWYISLNLHSSADLARFYDFTWHPVGNLGMDLLGPALAFVLPFEFAAKIGVILIIILTTSGMIWSAREVHGVVPPTVLLALPFAYAWPVQFGFVNFALGQAVALCALPVWLILGRQGRLVVRGGFALVIGFALWISHSSAWALFGLMAGGAEIGRLRQAGLGWGASLWRAVTHCLPLLVAPVVLIPMAPPSSGFAASDWFNIPAKLVWLASVLRDRWMPFDVASLLSILFVFYLGGRSSALGFEAKLGFPALLCFVSFLILPRLMMGGAYVDMRMIPATLILGLLAIKPARSAAMGRLLLIVGIAFFAARTLGTTISFFERDREQQRELGAIAAMPRGAAVLSLVRRPCNGEWVDLRRDHLPGLAIIRRDVFTNEQWQIGGQQLLKIRYTQAAPYLQDPSQLVYIGGVCHKLGSDFDEAIAHFPRRAFTHVWTIGYPPHAAKAKDLQLIWTNGGSALYRVLPPT